jgi:hypothetical protein
MSYKKLLRCPDLELFEQGSAWPVLSCAVPQQTISYDSKCPLYYWLISRVIILYYRIKMSAVEEAKSKNFSIQQSYFRKNYILSKEK